MGSGVNVCMSSSIYFGFSIVYYLHTWQRNDVGAGDFLQGKKPFRVSGSHLIFNLGGGRQHLKPFHGKVIYKEDSVLTNIHCTLVKKGHESLGLKYSEI